MNRNGFEIGDLSDMANSIRRKSERGNQLYRLFRVYHPVYELNVNIRTLHKEEYFHILESYMDRLVCGHLGSDDMPDEIYIGSKDELFELLGVDGEAYEVADLFYRNLIAAGHFREESRGIRALEPARESVRTGQRVDQGLVVKSMLFDQYSAKLLPIAFDDFKIYALHREDVDENDNQNRNAVWLEPYPMGPNFEANVRQRIGNGSYVNREQIDRGLPQGFRSMELTAGTPIGTAFYPYYLAIFRTPSGDRYQAYRIDNGEEIEWIGEQYPTGDYQDAVSLLRTLESNRSKNVYNPLYCGNSHIKFLITEDGEPSADHGVSMDGETGNYIWRLQDWQLKELLGLDGDFDKERRAVCSKVQNYDLCCLPSFEAGRIVRIVKTEAQKTVLKKALEEEGRASTEVRQQLYDAYLSAR